MIHPCSSSYTYHGVRNIQPKYPLQRRLSEGTIGTQRSSCRNACSFPCSSYGPVHRMSQQCIQTLWKVISVWQSAALSHIYSPKDSPPWNLFLPEINSWMHSSCPHPHCHPRHRLQLGNKFPEVAGATDGSWLAALGDCIPFGTVARTS